MGGNLEREIEILIRTAGNRRFGQKNVLVELALILSPYGLRTLVVMPIRIGSGVLLADLELFRVDESDAPLLDLEVFFADDVDPG